jgi:hypothetical protein
VSALPAALFVRVEGPGLYRDIYELAWHPAFLERIQLASCAAYVRLTRL